MTSWCRSLSEISDWIWDGKFVTGITSYYSTAAGPLGGVKGKGRTPTGVAVEIYSKFFRPLVTEKSRGAAIAPGTRPVSSRSHQTVSASAIMMAIPAMVACDGVSAVTGSGYYRHQQRGGASWGTLRVAPSVLMLIQH